MTMEASAPAALLTGLAIGITAIPAFRLLKSKLKPGGQWSKINRATSEPTHQKALPQGKHPLNLYSLATPNGQKVTIALEEMKVPYDAYLIDIMKGDQFSSGFVEINPNGKIPALLDREGPGGKPTRLFESASILLYLAEKTGQLIPKDPAERVECLNWLFFQVGSAPYIGQYGHFAKYAPVKIQYAIDRYTLEVKRIFHVLERHLSREGATPFLVGNELTIADIAWFPWVSGVRLAYGAGSVFNIPETYPALQAWIDRISSRPAVQKGLKINSTQEGGIPEYHSP